MKLYLVQHAKAASADVDPQRPLTQQGHRDIKAVAEFVKSLNLSVDYLWHSGKKRAEQTATTLAGVINVRNQCLKYDGLGPNDNVKLIKDDLASAQQDIMIVGHLPFLSKLVSLLLAGTETADVVGFTNGGILALSCCEKDRWQIDWIVTPELLV